MKKARFIKFALLISFTIILILSSGILLLIHYYPKDKILEIITENAESVLKRKVVIKGIDYGLSGISLSDISIYNKSAEEVRASVKDINIQFSLLPLLRKEIVINKIILDNFKIIISYEKGKSNFGDFLRDVKSPDSPGLKTKISVIEFNDAEVTLQDAPEVVKPLEGRYVFNGNLDIMSDNLYRISDCDVVLPGTRGNISTDNFIVSVSGNNFEITGDCELQGCDLLWVYTWDEILVKYLPYKNFTGHAKIRITKDIVDIYAKGKSDLPGMKIVSVDGRCIVDMIKETVSLQNIKANMRKSAFLINEILLTYSDKIKDTLLKFKISDIEADISDIKPILSFFPQDIMVNVSGAASGWITYENNMYSGKMNLKNATYRKKEKNILGINSEISLENNVIHMEKLPVFIYDQPCQVSINSSGKTFDKIILNLNADQLNLNFDKEDSSGMKLSKIKITPQVSGRIDIGDLNINDYNLSNAALNYTFSDGRLKVNQAAAKFMGGNIRTNGYIDVSGESPYINLSSGFDEIKVQNLVNLRKDMSGRFFGVLKGTSDMEFSLGSGSMLDSLKGKVEFNIDKGKLVDTGIQKGLGLWLSELKYKLSNLEFNKIYGNLSMAGKNCRVNSLLFNAPDIRLKMDGSFTTPSKENMEMPGDLKIDLEFNDYFIQDIPNLPQAQFITKLLRMPALKKKGGWYTMSFRDKGDDITEGKNIKMQ